MVEEMDIQITMIKHIIDGMKVIKNEPSSKHVSFPCVGSADDIHESKFSVDSLVSMMRTLLNNENESSPLGWKYLLPF